MFFCFFKLVSPVQRDDIRCLKNLVFWVWKHQLSMMLIGETSKSCLKAFGRRLHITSDFLRCLVFVLYIFSGVHSTPPPPPPKKKKNVACWACCFKKTFRFWPRRFLEVLKQSFSALKDHHGWTSRRIPKCSMHGIFTYIYPKNYQNVGKYALHWASGIPDTGN